MTIWFTSDTHFGHANIIKYCDRPFKDTKHMDAVIVSNWNSVVSPDDIVYHMGDVALGDINEGLANVGRLNGHKILVLGNHDKPFMMMEKDRKTGKVKPQAEDKYQAWVERYRMVFQEVHHWQLNQTVILDDPTRLFKVSHFPYTGDHTPADRHAEARPVDIGIPLIHGHTHKPDILTFSSKRTPQIHVGQDAWNFFPVAEAQILDVLDGVL